MYCLNLGYSWSLDNNLNLSGVIFAANSVHRPQFDQRDEPSNPIEVKLFDPQLYLSSLNASQTPLQCTRLASYPWFPTIIEEYNSEEKITPWFNRVRETIEEKWSSELPIVDEQIKELTTSCIQYQLDCKLT